ncbi:uncharacterized protein CDAR_612511 [Caerostris darwini]|uniref:Uncharacterized protein n=1 Tax=Caerostris darwini TaxID=1538125 RepID=A0AAV4SH10_9ARAC|nr:uncharacterized protein CDAR_612511 [Caerostris darwini]
MKWEGDCGTFSVLFPPPPVFNPLSMGFRNSEGCSQTKGKGGWVGEKRSRKSRSSSILPFPHKSLGWKIVRIPGILSLPFRGWRSCSALSVPTPSAFQEIQYQDTRGRRYCCVKSTPRVVWREGSRKEEPTNGE